MKSFLFISVFILATAGCRTTKDAQTGVEIIAIKHGTSFGHCVGHCTKEIVYDAAEIRYTQSSRDPKTYPDKVIVETTTPGAFKKLSGSIDLNKWNNLPETIGCPDCADGGAEYIEIKTKTGSRRVTFEAGSTPEGLEKILKTSRAKQTSFYELENAGE